MAPAAAAGPWGTHLHEAHSHPAAPPPREGLITSHSTRTVPSARLAAFLLETPGGAKTSPGPVAGALTWERAALYSSHICSHHLTQMLRASQALDQSLR